MRTTTTKRLALLPAAVIAGALLAGCGGSEAPPAETAQSEAAGEATPAGGGESGAPEPTESAEASAPAAAGSDAAVAAIATAEQEIPGSRAVSLDREDDGYDVTVVEGSTEHEVTTDSAGTSVRGTEPDDDEIDADDQDELDAASVTMTEAVEAALADPRADGLAVDEADLDTDSGTVVWKIEVDKDNADDVEIRVDAASGEIVN